MPRFLTGDEDGNIKILSWSPDTASGSKPELKTIRAGELINGRPNAVQALAINPCKLAAANADGSLRLYFFDGDRLEILKKWKESQLQAKQRFVGLRVSDRNVYSCTSGGVLRRANVMDSCEETPLQQCAHLPTRLRAWRQSSDEGTFAYGGDEVDLSVWNTEKAFSSIQDDSTVDTQKKRKRGSELLPGEVWRARNVSHDSLNIRQPIQITSLAYMSSFPTANHHQIITGTLLGDVRLYETRSARRPVADWKGIAKVGGVKVVEKGLADHEAFVADGGGNILALDSRVGKVIYKYKGIAGAVNSIAPAQDYLASTSLDRATRIHSTFPPAEPGERQEKKGEVLHKIYLNTIPTVVLWDQSSLPTLIPDVDGDDDLWESLQHVGDESAK